MEGTESYLASNYPQFPVPVTPLGLEAIYKACKRIYPDQPNPLQVTALVKYWLGGPDPLDYISMYGNPGDPESGIPPHWHYVSFGLSDLHGDGRVHDRCPGSDGGSGYGFELTFRLKQEADETAPPTWPAALMQALSRYVFQSGNTLCAGDHVPWHSPLDGSESRIQHMLMTDDIQLQPMNTPYGTVNFVQIVGVCAEELKAAQHWNGAGVVELLRNVALAGGPWLITDMRRGETVFEIDPQLQETVDQGIELEGSNLSGVSSRCSWEEVLDSDRQSQDSEEDKENRRVPDMYRSSSDSDKPRISEYESEQIKATLKKGLGFTPKVVLPPIKSEPTDHSHQDALCQRNGSRKESFDSNLSSEAPTELLRTRTLDAVHLKFNLEAGALLPLALRGRLRHGRHFTFKSVMNDAAITLVSTSVVGSIADEQHPYAAHGPWLQVLFTDDLIDRLLDDLSEISDGDEMDAPKTFTWPDQGLTITMVPDEV